MNIALLGFGVVGSGVYEWCRSREDLHVCRVLIRSDKPEIAGIATRDFDDILHDPNIDVVAEGMGGLHPAYEYVTAALKAGKHVVTANKALVAAYYRELTALADVCGKALLCTAAVGGVLFYVLLPLCLYIGSYLPYWWRDPAFSLSDWWQCQVSMFSYHATLKATHPFESRWYTWLLGLRPVWYYRNGYLPYGMKASIAGMAGPVIWLVGLAALVGLLWHQVSGRGSRQGAGVLILYGTQLIPWMLVTRCTFLYHYFPSSMFCLAALALVLARMKHVDWAKKIAAGLCVVALVLFVLYYPALSGLPIPAWWADALNALPSFGFY